MLQLTEGSNSLYIIENFCQAIINTNEATTEYLLQNFYSSQINGSFWYDSLACNSYLELKIYMLFFENTKSNTTKEAKNVFAKLVTKSKYF